VAFHQRVGPDDLVERSTAPIAGRHEPAAFDQVDEAVEVSRAPIVVPKIVCCPK
jgi:hypothetical protein